MCAPADEEGYSVAVTPRQRYGFVVAIYLRFNSQFGRYLKGQRKENPVLCNNAF